MGHLHNSVISVGLQWLKRMVSYCSRGNGLKKVIYDEAYQALPSWGITIASELPQGTQTLCSAGPRF